MYYFFSSYSIIPYLLSYVKVGSVVSHGGTYDEEFTKILVSTLFRLSSQERREEKSSQERREEKGTEVFFFSVLYILILTFGKGEVREGWRG